MKTVLRPLITFLVFAACSVALFLNAQPWWVVALPVLLWGCTSFYTEIVIAGITEQDDRLKACENVCGRLLAGGLVSDADANYEQAQRLLSAIPPEDDPLPADPPEHVPSQSQLPTRRRT